MFKGEKTVENPDYVHHVCENNVANTIKQIRKKSSIIRDLEKEGKVKVVGAIYDMSSGVVNFL
jgi:carbonic anhydrase